MSVVPFRTNFRYSDTTQPKSPLSDFTSKRTSSRDLTLSLNVRPPEIVSLDPMEIPSLPSPRPVSTRHYVCVVIGTGSKTPKISTPPGSFRSLGPKTRGYGWTVTYH